MYPITSQITRPITLPINDYGAAPPGPSGYQIGHSLRFRSSASAYLSRTPASAGNGQIFTVAFWVKRGTLSASGQNTMFITQSIGGIATEFLFNQDNLRVYYYNGGYVYQKITTQVFRDTSAWYHIVWSVDTTQATASNRVRLYVNGVQITSFSTSLDPNQNVVTDWNSAKTVYCSISSGATMFDGYLADIYNIDGQALDPTSFGAFDATTGVWTPKSYAGTYGTNGFHLNFSNGTSTTTLGYDSSGNSNNWTPNNISLTAGSTYDSMLDSPTNYDNGGTGVGNYAVLNPLYAYSSLTLAGANLNIASSANYRSGMASFGMSSGKWYWEYVVTAVGNDTILGISSNPSVTIASYPGNDALSWGYEAQVGNKYNNGSFSAYGATYTTNDVIGTAFDADAGSLTFYKNGVSQGIAYSGLASGIYYAAFGLGTSSTGSANFGQRPFAYTPPTGYKALNTQNLPAPSIQNGANFMAATLYTGTGATQSIVNAVNGVSFQPDLVWTKARSAALAGLMYDSVRGATKYLQTNSTGAEGTGADSLTAFNANGFSAGADTSTTGVNQNGTTYVGWQWKAGGTAVTNTAGSITSSVSANTTAGFSVVAWAEPSSGVATMGHGLGIAPAMVIIKSRASGSYWGVYHQSIGATKYLRLNTTDAATTASTVWNNTDPTSSVFTVGTDFNGVGNSIAYCFAAIPGYSAFGSYTGNGSADGPFVYLGFRPRWIMFKRSDGVNNWVILDTSRNTYNVMNATLWADLSSAEGSYTWCDYLSNGFKFRDGSNGLNNSGGNYIYAAFAENPFTNALAR